MLMMEMQSIKKQFDDHNKYYYYTKDLKHNNENRIKFPTGTSNFPFITNIIHPQYSLKIRLSGYYYISYSDFYKGQGSFQIKYNYYSGINSPNPIFHINMINQTDWTPITINSLVYINKDINNSNEAEILMNLTSGNAIFKGVGYSSFYIKFLHA